MARLLDGGGDRLEVLAADAAEFHLVARERGGSHESAGLDAVRNHGVLDAAKLLDALDDDPAGARAGDFRPHGIEEIRQIHHFGFRRGRFDDRHAFSQSGRHHHVVGAEHGRAVSAGHVDLRAAQTVRRAEDDIAALELDTGTERLQSPQVEIHRAVADHAAARQGNHRPAHTGKQRPHHADRGAHPPNQFVGGGVGNFTAGDAHGAGRTFDVGTHHTEDLHHVVGVRDIRHAANDAGLGGEQRGRQDGQ